MPQYLLSVWADGSTPSQVSHEMSPELMEKAYAQVDAFNTEVKAAGAWVFAGGLQAASTASVVHSSGGEVTTTPGPSAQGPQVLGGFWVITADDLEAALAWAAKGSSACMGPVEVRPFQDVPGD